MKDLEILIYINDLKTLGGGEKYSGKIAEILSRENKVKLLTKFNVDKKKIKDTLNVDLSKVEIITDDEFRDEKKITNYSKRFDLFINATYKSLVLGGAKKNIVVVYFPIIQHHKYPVFLKKIGLILLSLPIFKFNEYWNRKYKEQVEFFNRINYLRKFDKVISISKYTKHWIKKINKLDSSILYPMTETERFIKDHKEKIIMSVGRFFIDNHNKKQLEMIRTFKKMYDENPNELKGFEYHLCGSVHYDYEGGAHQKYFEKCLKEAEGYPIFIHTDYSFDQLRRLYSRALIFWHAAGLNENPNIDPDKFEHFGMVSVEAMASGTIPIVINMAGQKEIVKDGFDGFRWDTTDELIEKTLLVIKDKALQNNLSKNALRSSEQFNLKSFEKTLDKILQE